MKRLFTLVALLGLLGIFTGCKPAGDGTTMPDTNAVPAAPAAPAAN